MITDETRWPCRSPVGDRPRHQLRAAFGADPLTVCQAYPPEIAGAAPAAGRMIDADSA